MDKQDKILKLLRETYEVGPVPMSFIMQETKLPRSTAMAILKKLIKARIVFSDRQMWDRRRVNVYFVGSEHLEK